MNEIGAFQLEVFQISLVVIEDVNVAERVVCAFSQLCFENLPPLHVGWLHKV